MSRPVDSERREKVKELHGKSFTNRQIAKLLGSSHKTVGLDLQALGLLPNGTTRGVLEIRGDMARCTKCTDWKPLNQFAMIRRGKPDEYRLTYCNRCRLKQYNNWCNNSLDSFWQRRFTAWQKKAKEKGCEWSLTLAGLKAMFESQNGKCFYTDVPLHMGIGKGHLDNSMSIDKIVPEQGYVEGNVVLCTKKINTVKNCLTLEEMKQWMPPLYQRLVTAGYVKEF